MSEDCARSLMLLGVVLAVGAFVAMLGFIIEAYIFRGD